MKNFGADSVKMEERVAIVTGGDRGIGRAITVMLARNGVNISIIYRKDIEAVTQTIKEVEAIGQHAIALSADVASDDHVAQAVKETVKAFGKVDILVSNAGIASRGKTVVDSDIEEARRLFEIHALGAMRFTKLVVP